MDFIKEWIVERGRDGCSQGFEIAPRILEFSQGFGVLPGFWRCS